MKSKINPLALILGLSVIFFILFMVISVGLVMKSGSNSKTMGDSQSFLKKMGPQKSLVGVVELNGAIMDSKKTIQKLEDLEEDTRVKAVVLRLNSPGGAVAPSQEIYETVKHYSKPLIVSMGSLAASGAYYIAVGSKKVYANPGTATGSIGVIMSMANLEKLYDWAKVKRYAIKTGKFKDAGAEYRDLLPEERAYFQGVVDSMLVQFKQAVATGRKLTTEQVDAVADGRVFSGTQAKELGLVDEIGTFQDAVKEAGKLAGIQGKPKLLYPRKKVNFFKVLSDMQQESEDESEAEESSSVVDRLVNRFSGQLAERLAGKVLGEALPQQSTRQPGFYMLWSL